MKSEAAPSIISRVSLTQIILIGLSICFLFLINFSQPAISQQDDSLSRLESMPRPQTELINLANSSPQSDFVTQVIKQLLEELDYQVEIISPVSKQEFQVDVATGKIDLWVNQVLKKQRPRINTGNIGQNLQVIDGLIKNTNCNTQSCLKVANNLEVVAHKKFLQIHPQIKKLLEIVEIPLEEIKDYQARLRANSPPTLAQEYAQEWITENQGRVRLWLTLARDEAIITQSTQSVALSDYARVGEKSPQNLAKSVVLNQESDTKLPFMRVATKRFEPLVGYENDQYTGFSIDFWDAIAEDLNIDYEIYGVDTIENLLEQVKTQQANLAIAGITITAEREQEIDFSHPYYESGLQILVSNRQNSLSQTIWSRISSVLTSPKLYRGIGIFILILLLAAHIIWFTERKHNPEFPKSYLSGIWESLWWAAVTVTTVGYGDKTPRKLPGRIFGLFWMCAGYFIFAYFTASVTTSFTIEELNANIQGVQDLRGKQVGTVIGTTADKYLQGERIDFVGYKTKEEAYLALKDRKVDAVVYDAPALQYYASQEGAGKVKVVGKLFELQDYGVALPLNSPYRKDINATLLKLMENGTYQEISNKWFGTR